MRNFAVDRSGCPHVNPLITRTEPTIWGDRKYTAPPLLAKILNLKLTKSLDWITSLYKYKWYRNMLNNTKEMQSAKYLKCKMLYRAHFFNKINGNMGEKLLYVKRYFRVISTIIISAFSLWPSNSTSGNS